MEPIPVMREIYLWLGVAPDFVPPTIGERANMTKESTQVRGLGLFHQIRHSSAWGAAGSFVPPSLRRFARKLAVKQVLRNEVSTDEVEAYLRPIQEEQTRELEERIESSFPNGSFDAVPSLLPTYWGSSQPESSRTIGLEDVVTATQLIAMALTDRFCPESYHHGIDARCAHLHIALRGSKVRPILGPAAAPDLDLSELERKFMTSVYEDMRHTLREYRSRGWNPEIQLRGEHHLTDALTRGNGAVLWGYSSTLGGLVGRKALHAGGIRRRLLSSDVRSLFWFAIRPPVPESGPDEDRESLHRAPGDLRCGRGGRCGVAADAAAS